MKITGPQPQPGPSTIRTLHQNRFDSRAYTFTYTMPERTVQQTGDQLSDIVTGSTIRQAVCLAKIVMFLLLIPVTGTTSRNSR